jgi:hypothetical protein
MNTDDHYKSQPLRELQWLAHYFNEHGREELAEKIFDEVKKLRHRAQDSLETTEASDVVDFKSANNDSNSGTYKLTSKNVATFGIERTFSS